MELSQVLGRFRHRVAGETSLSYLVYLVGAESTWMVESGT